MKNPFTRKDVEEVLQQFPNTRDSDLELANKMCQNKRVYLLMADRVAIGNFVTRERRRFQSQWYYTPLSEKIKKRRWQLREIYKMEYTPTKINIQEKVLNNVMAWV